MTTWKHSVNIDTKRRDALLEIVDSHPALHGHAVHLVAVRLGIRAIKAKRSLLAAEVSRIEAERAAGPVATSTWTVNLDEESAQALQDITTAFPGLRRHAAHLVVLRLGLRALQARPSRLLEELQKVVAERRRIREARYAA